MMMSDVQRDFQGAVAGNMGGTSRRRAHTHANDGAFLGIEKHGCAMQVVSKE